jgi:hypothetical protein
MSLPLPSQRPHRLVLLLAAGLLAAAQSPGSLGDVRDGPLPNLALPTLGGTQLWVDEAWREGWRVQRHVWTGHHRLLDPHDVRRAWGEREACSRRLRELVPEVEPRGELVVLVHGLGRTRHSLARLARHLEREGFATARFGYPSTRRSIDDHAEALRSWLDRLEGVERVSFVTHSLGGIVVRAALERPPAPGAPAVGRVVMLAPPSRGSSLAHALERWRPIRWILGPSGGELGDGAGLTVAEPPPSVAVAVVAGARGRDGGWNPLVPGDDDGIVGVDETRLERPHEHLVVRGMHTWLMNRPAVREAVLRFLRREALDGSDAPGRLAAPLEQPQ